MVLVLNFITNIMYFRPNAVFLGAFAEFQIGTISFFRSLRPSVYLAWNSSIPTGQIFIKFDMIMFRKSVMKVEVRLKSETKSGI